jgi:hypothetical protein
MKTIREHFNSLGQDDWDYYNDFTNRVLENPFFVDNHTRFIKKYFARSGKEIVLNLIDIKDNEIKKANHTNSIFFLGILFHKKIFKDKDFFMKYNAPGYKEFPFIWFLTCLFHDLGMKYEYDETELTKKIVDFDLLKKELNITNCLLDEKITGIDKTLFSNIRQYFNYRRIVHKKLDHGIVAGIYLFDKLVKNRIEKQKKRQNRLNWKKELEKQYALVASTIAMHNIWLPNDKTACDYIKFEMKSLINFKPITLRKFPLLYLLGIVDTIDPIKTYEKNHTEDYIIDNLQVDFLPNEIIFENKDNSKLDFTELLKKSDNLIGWLNVVVKKKENRLSVIIK